MQEIDLERFPGWHWSGGKKIEVGTPLACGIPFMSPRGGLCTDDPKGVQCVECLKILEAPTNTLRLAEVGKAAVAWQGASDAYHSPERERNDDDTLQRAWLRAEDALTEAVRAFQKEIIRANP